MPAITSQQRGRSTCCLRTTSQGWRVCRLHDWLVWGLLCLAPGATPLAAERPEGRAAEEIFLEKMPVVLSATRLAQPVSESPAAITVIDREMIEASGAIEIPDLFRLVPGFQVGHVNGHTGVVTYHGLTDKYARRMQVLVDGRSVYTPLFGGVQWSDLPLAIEDIERIEVIRGPNGVTYGANAFAAVINILTRDPQLDRGTRVQVTRGDIETRKTLLRHGGETGNLNYRVTAAQRQDDGIIPQPDNKRVTLLTFRGEQRVTDRDTLDIQLGHNSGPRGKGDATSLTSPPREEQVKSYFAQLRWRRVLGPDEELGLQFYHNYHHVADTYRTALLSRVLGTTPAAILATFGRPDQQINATQDATAERYDVELSHTLRPRADLRVAWGTELRLDRVASDGWFGRAEFLSNRLRRLFANAEWRITPAWILNGGAMYEHNSITGGEVSPRLAINHHLAPGHTIRAGLTRAYRTPSLYEQHADTSYKFSDGAILDQLYKHTVSLTPERIDAGEIGYSATLLSSRLTLDLKLFREIIRDAIASPSDPTITDALSNGAGTFRNDGHAEVTGGEAQLRYLLTPRTLLHLAYGYANQEGRSLTRTSPVTHSDTGYATPTETTHLLLTHRLVNGLDVSAQYRIVTDMEYLGGGTERTGTYTTADLRLAKKFRGGGTRGEFSFVVQNAAGAYFDFDDSATLDTRHLFTLALEFR